MENNEEYIFNTKQAAMKAYKKAWPNVKEKYPFVFKRPVGDKMKWVAILPKKEYKGGK